MSQKLTDHTDDPLQQLKRALSRWDNEGGAEPNGAQSALAPADGVPPMPDYDTAEVGTLHVRVIALESLLVAMLAAASHHQLETVSGMATYMAPRAGYTRHPLTTRAAAHMIDLVDRAAQIRGGESAD